MIFMVQREVAHRLLCIDYGKIGVLSLILNNVKKCFDVKPSSFFPAPKVFSSVVSFENKYLLNNNQKQDLMILLTLIFNNPRKKIGNSLKNFEILRESKFNYEQFYDKRPEELCIQDYLTILKF
jgi:16S rRNA (adenine1518-N6/adenine1519-N6)-dimethyltransferase